METTQVYGALRRNFGSNGVYRDIATPLHPAGGVSIKFLDEESEMNKLYSFCSLHLLHAVESCTTAAIGSDLHQARVLLPLVFLYNSIPF
jgi:hypothetical protein